MVDLPKRLYEGLFLLSQQASTDLAAAVEHVQNILTRHQAEILVLRKWDERKLAYPIRGQKRGIYLLAYFKAPPSEVAGIDRDCVLSETVLRALIIHAPHVGEVELELAKREAHLGIETRLRSEADKAPAEAVDTLEEEEEEVVAEDDEEVPAGPSEQESTGT